MATNATLPGVLNPNTPLVYLTPEQAYETSVSNYVLVGSLGVLLWDVLDNISEDFNIVFRSRFRLSTAAYIGSRIGSLGYIIGASIFQTAPTGNCVHFETIVDAFYPVSLGCSALLFFFRLRAIYNRDRIVVACFFVLWCGLLTCTIFIPAGILGGTIGPTKYCIDKDVPPSAFAAIIAPLVHDTLVFIAISWRLAQNQHGAATVKGNLKAAMFGSYLPRFSKSLLLDGQRYYLITLISNVVTVIMVYDTSVPIPLRSMCATPNILLTSIMACRVYRRTRAGFFREVEISTTAMAEKQRHHPKTSIAIAVNTFRAGPGPSVDGTYSVEIELPSRTDSQPTNVGYEESLPASRDDEHAKRDFSNSFGDIEKGRH